MENQVNIELIQNHIKENNLSATRFCKIFHIGYRTYKKIMTGQLNVDVLAFFKIARAINSPVHMLFRKVK